MLPATSAWKQLQRLLQLHAHTVPMREAAPWQQQQLLLGLGVRKQGSGALVSVCLQHVWEHCSSWGEHVSSGRMSSSSSMIKMMMGMRLLLVCSLASDKQSAGGSRGQQQQPAQLVRQTLTVMGSRK
jgi:hypothetical protein